MTSIACRTGTLPPRLMIGLGERSLAPPLAAGLPYPQAAG
jgi:hypothetical protein